jgi:hypothetical protein
MNHVSLQWIVTEVQDADPNSQIPPHPSRRRNNAGATPQVLI